MKNIGLVLEGGGMRGLYTSGVLDFFIDNNIYFPYVIGVSAGACNAISYISRQKGRNKNINVNYVRDKRYISIGRLIKDKELFGTDFLFNDIPNVLCPLDYETFNNAKETFVVCTTDCETGKPVYYYKNNSPEFFDTVKASMSLPFISKIVQIKDKYLLDGGIADAIPIKKSISDGNDYNVVILTRHQGYRKKPFKNRRFANYFYPQYPNLVDALCKRHEMYNETLDYIDQLDSSGRAFVIRPSEPLPVKRIERNPKKLLDVYNKGYHDAEKIYSHLTEWINKIDRAV
ncbi:MAG: patatin family protein [Epulopiscium sp.]|nr:patatin family protein [Candidatus Epulonipiscium sp.]NLM13893.1 patatin family protein [Candidatus Epulonipiscium sp.]